MASALEGLRILELSVGMAGAMAGMVLAENGADLIKVEPPTGDPTRSSDAFLVWHRGKKSVILDLKTASGLEDFKRLADGADGLVEDMSPGAAERLGVGYAALRPINPKLVYVSITGFGERGPLKGLPGYEGIVAAKTGRMASQEGFREGPIFTPTPIASYGAGMLAAQGLLASLVAREKTGVGQRVHTSLQHALTAYDMGGFLHRMHKNDEEGEVFGVMPLAFMTALCADGRFIQMCSRQPHLFRNWMRVLGLEHLYDDPAFHRMPDSFPSRQDMLAILEMVEARMRERTMDEWLELFPKEDVGGDPFLAAPEFLDHIQTAANGRRSIVVDPRVGETVQIGPLAILSETPASIGTPAPELGEHDEEVLGPLRTQPIPGPRAAAPRASLKHPLEGITAVECAYFYAAPFSMTLLAEMGARVIKVEPPEGDPMRRNWSSTYSKAAIGKESIIANMKMPEGRRIVHELVSRADLFLHNFRPGVPERLEIDYRTLSSINPKLVYVYGSCYGSKGPWSHRPGFHSTPNALAGSGIIESGRGNPPKDRSFPDPAGALGVATCAMVGLNARERTGKGQYIETTMINSLGYVVAPWGLQYEGKAEAPMPDQGQHGYHALHRLYEAKEGWVFLVCESERHWNGLTEVLGVAGMRTDARFSTANARRENDDALADAIQSALMARSADGWEGALLAAGVPGVRADGTSHADYMLNHPQVRENGLAIEDDLPGVGRFWRSSSCLEYSDMSSSTGSVKPLGWATESVLRELGYSGREMDDLTERGVTKVVGHGMPTA